MNCMDCSLPGSSVHGILQARTLEWLAIPFSRGSSWPRDQTRVSCIDRQVLYHLSYQGNLPGLDLCVNVIHTLCGVYVHAKSLQLYLTLCNPMDCSLPVSSVHGVLPARILCGHMVISTLCHTMSLCSKIRAAVINKISRPNKHLNVLK